jgi:hypothetical protein
MMAKEERKVVSVVHWEKERIAQGIEIITHAIRKGRLRHAS